MKIVITGGTGFVGRQLGDMLGRAGDEVVLADVQGPDQSMYQYADVTSMSQLHVVFQGANLVIHLAGVSNTNEAWHLPRAAYEVNSIGTQNVMQVAFETGVERVMIASTTLLSGLQIPFKMEWPRAELEVVDDPDNEGITLEVLRPELDWEVVDERSPIQPLLAAHPYVTSKLAAEMIARDWTAKAGIAHTVFRFGIMYGPGMALGVLVDNLVKRALAGQPLLIEGDGQQWRQYLHVSDLCSGIVAACDEWQASENETFNLCGPEKVTVAQVAAAVEKVVPGTAIDYRRARPHDIPVRLCLAERARRLLGWQQKISLEDGIRETVEWYRSR